jgi:hypothetical protein
MPVGLPPETPLGNSLRALIPTQCQDLEAEHVVQTVLHPRVLARNDKGWVAGRTRHARSADYRAVTPRCDEGCPTFATNNTSNTAHATQLATRMPVGLPPEAPLGNSLHATMPTGGLIGHGRGFGRCGRTLAGGMVTPWPPTGEALAISNQP